MILFPHSAKAVTFGDRSAGVLARLGVRRVVADTRGRALSYVPAYGPLLRLDRIYCRPRHALLQSFTDPKARAIFDHLPVIADLQLG